MTLNKHTSYVCGNNSNKSIWPSTVMIIIILISIIIRHASSPGYAHTVSYIRTIIYRLNYQQKFMSTHIIKTEKCYAVKSSLEKK